MLGRLDDPNVFTVLCKLDYSQVKFRAILIRLACKDMSTFLLASFPGDMSFVYFAISLQARLLHCPSS